MRADNTLSRTTEARKVLIEGLLVAAAGAAVAFAANWLSPRGLALARNYFPAESLPAANQVPATNATTGIALTNPPSPSELVAARLKAAGLQLAGSNQVLQLFHDPRYQQDLIAFVDARNEEHYQNGHIPGACLFDYYHPVNYLSNVLQVCMMAQEVVVYCNGGDCEDSELSATMLRDLGVQREKILVYGGGIAEWTSNNLPVELGARRSGNLRYPNPPPSTGLPASSK